MAPKTAENPKVMIETEGEVVVCFHRLVALREAKQEANNFRNPTRLIRTPQSKSQQRRSV